MFSPSCRRRPAVTNKKSTNLSQGNAGKNVRNGTKFGYAVVSVILGGSTRCVFSFGNYSLWKVTCCGHFWGASVFFWGAACCTGGCPTYITGSSMNVLNTARIAVPTARGPLPRSTLCAGRAAAASMRLHCASHFFLSRVSESSLFTSVCLIMTRVLFWFRASESTSLFVFVCLIVIMSFLGSCFHFLPFLSLVNVFVMYIILVSSLTLADVSFSLLDADYVIQIFRDCCFPMDVCCNT